MNKELSEGKLRLEGRGAGLGGLGIGQDGSG